MIQAAPVSTESVTLIDALESESSARHTSIWPEAKPVERANRITAIDSIRGFAVLGILLMNIVGMGEYGAAYIDPTIIGGANGANLFVWAVMHVVADGKMRCLFSMLFGASALLLTSRFENRKDAADIYYRRILWLLLFGILHAYLLWFGDILYAYAMCGLLLYPFRKLRPRTLMTIGATLFLVDSGIYIAQAYALSDMISKGVAAEQAKERGVNLTRDQQEDADQYEQWRKVMRPTSAELKRDADQWRGNPLNVIKARAKIVFTYFHNAPYYSPENLDILCMMFLGMALFKGNVLTGTRPRAFYWKLLLIGYGIGLPLNAYTAWLIVRSRFDPVIYSFSNALLDPGRFLVAAGHLSLVVLLVKAGWLKTLLRGISAIGQTAFSNYILQSLITAFLFTGYGFRLYDRLERYQLYYVVAGIWILQLIASPIWLRHFQFGPLEWCWRSLSYWKRQPMRLHPAT